MHPLTMAIGHQVNLSGGQKARGLPRRLSPIYTLLMIMSQSPWPVQSTLGHPYYCLMMFSLLVCSMFFSSYVNPAHNLSLKVDAHTAHHLYHECLKGELMKGRTVILVSHHVQLCAPDANYIVALDNGRVQFEGTREAFQTSGVIRTLMQSTVNEIGDEKEEQVIEEIPVPSSHSSDSDPSSETTTIAPTPATVKMDKKPARKLVEEETRAVGRVSKSVWLTYIRACGSCWYWILFTVAYIIAALSPVAENGWLKQVYFFLFLITSDHSTL